MFRRNCLLFVLIVCSVVAVSCSKTEDAGQPTVDDPATSYDDGRTTLDGRWLVTIIRGGRAVPLFLVDLTAADDQQFDASLISSIESFQGAKIKRMNVADGLAELDFEIYGEPLLFQGRLEKGIVVGNISLMSGQIALGRMIASEEEAVDAYEPVEEPHLKSLAAAWESSKDLRIGKLTEFANKYSTFSLALRAARELLVSSVEMNAEIDAVEKDVTRYLSLVERWGPRMVQEARMNVASDLGKSQALWEIALKYSLEAEANFPENPPDRWKNRITLAKGRALIRADNNDQRGQGAEILHKIHTDNIFDHVITNDLLNYERSHGDLDKAVDLAAELVAFPPTSGVLTSWQIAGRQDIDLRAGRIKEFTDLWVKKHGSEVSSDPYLNDVYKRSLDAIVAEKIEPRKPDEANRIAVCELFTGVACLPCIAADVALVKIESSFSPNEVIVMRYHQHANGPDPLVNSDADGRAFYYRVSVTPRVFVNGAVVEKIGGPLDRVANSYGSLREFIDPLLEKKTELRINLSAEATDGIVNISASVDGLPSDVSYLKLRLVLTEDELSLAAPNGIRIHEHIVRTFPGGLEGIGVTDGRLEYSGTVDLAELKKKINSYLTTFENGSRTSFTEKPLDLEHLHVVALVQDDYSKKILQATRVSVEGLVPVSSEDAEADANPPEEESPFEPETSKKSDDKPTDDKGDSAAESDSTKLEATPE